MTYAVELQTLEAHGIPCIECHYQPDNATMVELGDTQYITAVKEPGQSTNRYLVTLLNRFTGQEQKVDLVILESGFSPMVTELRKHYGYAWELFDWMDCDAPF